MPNDDYIHVHVPHLYVYHTHMYVTVDTHGWIDAIIRKSRNANNVCGYNGRYWLNNWTSVVLFPHSTYNSLLFWNIQQTRYTQIKTKKIKTKKKIHIHVITKKQTPTNKMIA